jgi:MtfA peptidase
MYNRLRFRVLVIVFSLFALYAIYERSFGGLIVASSVLVLGVAIRMFPESNSSTEYDEQWDQVEENAPAKSDVHTFYGEDLEFEDEELLGVLNKHWPYYIRLSDKDKKRFLNRLSDFLADKTFNFHKGTPYRAMPILISASAIQFSLGLEDYLLPHFEYINIYPNEFFYTSEGNTIVEGSVTNRYINISWRNFVDGYKMPQDGQNVGLHEMAHAYYYQNLGPCNDTDECFISGYRQFEEHGKVVFQQITNGNPGIYSDYSKKNFQEFWAVTVELFFEKPSELKTLYPDLYSSVTNLLKQDPASIVAA